MKPKYRQKKKKIITPHIIICKKDNNWTKKRSYIHLLRMNDPFSVLVITQKRE